MHTVCAILKLQPWHLHNITIIIHSAQHMRSPCSINSYDSVHNLNNIWTQFSDVIHDTQYLCDLASNSAMEGALRPEQHKHDDTACMWITAIITSFISYVCTTLL